MRILLANPRGVCAGVDMAIQCLDVVLQYVPAPIFVYHEIVHNQYVVQQFERRGVVFVEALDVVPRGATLVFSAHGVSPAIRRQALERQLRTIDATCPLVAKVHAETIRFAQLGYHIILIGHAGHDEILGTLGEAPEHITLVENEEDVRRLAFPHDQRLAYLTQTTLGVQETDRTVGRLKARFPRIAGPTNSDICYATHNRQQAVQQLAKIADVVLVVGSQNSSNSRRLCEVAQEQGTVAHLIDDDQDLQPDWFSADSSVGVTAGASAPEVSVQAVVAWLQHHFPGAEVSTLGTGEETRKFPLPSELHQLTSRTHR